MLDSKQHCRCSHHTKLPMVFLSPGPSQPRVPRKPLLEQPFLSHTPLPVHASLVGSCYVACLDRNAKKLSYIHLGLRPENLWRSFSGCLRLHPFFLFTCRSLAPTLSLLVLVFLCSQVPSSMLTMETSCFLTSKLSPKNMAMPSPAGVAKPKHLMLFNNKRASSSVTCCSYNDAAPVIDRDWRSFRAQLYFNEQYSKSVDQAVAAVAAAAATPEPVKIGDKWAHPLVEPEKGCLLIATEKLDGSHIFERTVILLLSAGVLGPVGVILNRPSLMSIKEAQTIFADTDIAGAFSGRPLFFGGPLEECFFLLGPRVSAGDVVGRTGLFEEVMPGLHYGTRESVGCAAELVKRGVVGVRDFRFFDGFCGWEREQLRDEVRAGLWHVAACSPAVLGLASVVKGGLWEEVQGLVGESRVW